MKQKKREHKLNSEITFSEIRVTDEGIMSLTEALRLAESKSMDLVLINEKGRYFLIKLSFN